MPECLICRSPIQPFHRFGPMPIANGFLTPEQFQDEFFFNLEVGYCPICHMVQLTELVDPDRLFHADYAYFSSISLRMAEHFRRFADWTREKYVSADDPLVVEVGSNDGILLKNFAAAGVPHVGIEPSENVAAAARQIGVNTLCRFFDEETARQIRAQYGPADVVLGANVICHIPDLHTIARAVNRLLKEGGVFIFEEPYLGDILAQTSYDQIYDEHVFYFSLHALGSLFERHEMEVIDALPQSVHGGSMRWVVARKGSRRVSPAVTTLWEQEQQEGLARTETFTAFSRRIDESRDRLVKRLCELKRQNKRVAAYGATSKSTTVTNFCSIGPDLVEFICDTTPGKQGKFSPGVHIPVVPYERFVENYPDDALLFAWNHAAEIVEKEQAFREAGGRFLVYVPDVRILE